MYDPEVELKALFQSQRVTPDRVNIRACVIPECFVDMMHFSCGKTLQPAGLGWVFNRDHIFEMVSYCHVVLQEPLRTAMCNTGRMPVTVLDKLSMQAVLHELPHVKPDEPSMVYYLAKPEHLLEDRWTKTRAGRYLRRHIKEADAESIKQLAANLRGEYSRLSLHFTECNDANAIEYVYVNGPDSCMSGAGKYRHNEIRVNGESFHPMRVMAHPDNNLRLAYLMDDDGTVVARAWTNCEHMTYCTVYAKTDTYAGAVGIFEAYLERAGYVESHSATMRYEPISKVITDCEAIVCPYIDPSNMGVDVESDHLVIGGCYQSNYETGCLEDFDLASEYHRYCESCADSYHEDAMTHVEDTGEVVCENCLDSNYIYGIVGWSRGSWDYDWFREDRAEMVAYPDSTMRSRFVHEDIVGGCFAMLTAGAHEGRVADMEDVVFCEITDECWHIKDLDAAGMAYCGDCCCVYDADGGCPECGDY